MARYISTPTEKMKADVFTKNITGKKFNSYMEALMCKKHEVKREEKSALLAYFFKTQHANIEALAIGGVQERPTKYPVLYEQTRFTHHRVYTIYSVSHI
jgi:hypothetical protein